MTLFLIVLLTSLAVTAGLVLGKRWHIGLTGDVADEAPHKIHNGTVPRVGGLAIYVAGLSGMVLLSPQLDNLTAFTMWAMWGCLSLIFITGLGEDLTRRVPPAVRYGAAFAGAMFFSLALGGFGITSVGIEWLDGWLANPLVRVLFFAFAVAGMAHAFNLIDGQNGLCSGYSLIVFLALAVIAHGVGQTVVAQLSLAMAAANLGFLLFNFPTGSIFLGDGGAYFNGAIVAVLTVFLVEGSPQVSPWVAILLLIYPIWETLFSMLRRQHAGQAFYKPDRDHLHHRICGFAMRSAGFHPRYSASLVLLLVAPFVALSPLVTDRPALAGAYALAFVVVYLCAYQRAGSTADLGEAVGAMVAESSSAE